jgi:hypothetical protein
MPPAKLPDRECIECVVTGAAAMTAGSIVGHRWRSVCGANDAPEDAAVHSRNFPRRIFTDDYGKKFASAPARLHRVRHHVPPWRRDVFGVDALGLA